MCMNFLKRRNTKLKARYSEQVKKYFNNNSFIIIQRIRSGMLNAKKCNQKMLSNVFGNYPKAPWINISDYISQFVALLTEIGYPIASIKTDYANIDNDKLCQVIIQYYLNINGKEIMDRLADSCIKTEGKTTYEQARIALGFECNQIDSTLKVNVDKCTLLFLKQMGVPFKYNSTHIYLP